MRPPQSVCPGAAARKLRKQLSNYPIRFSRCWSDELQKDILKISNRIRGLSFLVSLQVLLIHTAFSLPFAHTVAFVLLRVRYVNGKGQVVGWGVQFWKITKSYLLEVEITYLIIGN